MPRGGRRWSTQAAGRGALARAAMPSSRSLSISLFAACTAASCSSRHFSAAVSLPWAAESAATTACELFPIMSRTARPSCLSWLLNRRYCNLSLASVGRGWKVVLEYRASKFSRESWSGIPLDECCHVNLQNVSRDEVPNPRRNDLSAFNLPAPWPR